MLLYVPKYWILSNHTQDWEMIQIHTFCNYQTYSHENSLLWMPFSACIFIHSLVYLPIYPSNKYWRILETQCQQKRHDPCPHGDKQGCLALKIGLLRFLSRLPKSKNEITLLLPVLHALFNACLSSIAMSGLVLVLRRWGKHGHRMGPQAAYSQWERQKDK